MAKDKTEALKQLRQEAQLGGGEKRVEKQHESGKLTARERLEILLDKNSFEEIDAFVRHRGTDFGIDKQSYP
ncbi:MAG: carboxyl transferase domain-containing protein, partial [Balneolales bacterium]